MSSCPQSGTPRITVIIPVFNEQKAIQNVLSDIPAGLVTEILVVDNGSTDETARLAHEMGARVIREPQRGYGSACLAGMAAADRPDIVVFLDGDFSDHPEEMDHLLQPIRDGGADMVIGSRILGRRESGALLPQARVGNWLATVLIRALYRVTYTDLGPFRAIRWSSLYALGMQDTTFGWTVEMQVKAAIHRLKSIEVPVNYRRRVGVSKITGTWTGTLRAGWKILSTIFRLRLFPPRR